MPCVAIETKPDGTVTVGTIPPEAVAQYAQAMQPAKSVEDALGVAMGLLSEGTQPPDEQTWNQVQRDRQMESQPGGPLMGK